MTSSHVMKRHVQHLQGQNIPYDHCTSINKKQPLADTSSSAVPSVNTGATDTNLKFPLGLEGLIRPNKVTDRRHFEEAYQYQMIGPFTYALSYSRSYSVDKKHGFFHPRKGTTRKATLHQAVIDRRQLARCARSVQSIFKYENHFFLFPVAVVPPAPHRGLVCPLHRPPLNKQASTIKTDKERWIVHITSHLSPRHLNKAELRIKWASRLQIRIYISL
ncbi:hypothetical protein J6590_004312 [Homalodisca vitripennis]|nr:hypothetical protein J6590_004312 [Homalodisca vitripennis]